MLNDYFGGYITVAAFTAFGFILVGLAIWASGLIRPNKPNRIKSETYECGIDPVGGGWSQTHIRYYIFALLFLIFDVEAVFIFPWAINLELFSSPEIGMGAFILVEMVIFIVILVLGLVYALRKGVLRWE